MNFILLLVAGILSFSHSNNVENIFSPTLSWHDEMGKNFSLSSLKGKLVFISMIYTSCKKTCPLTVQTMEAFQHELQAKNKNPEFVLISLDPQNDNEPSLSRWKKQQGLLDSPWHVLRGSPDSTREVADAIGFQYVEDSEHILHDFRIVEIDESENIREVFDWDHRRLN